MLTRIYLFFHAENILKCVAEQQVYETGNVSICPMLTTL